MASVISKAARSAGLNNPLFRQSATAAIFSSELPAALLPAALESIQNGQVTICAARRHARARNSAGNVLLRPGAALNARLASRMVGQRAWIPTPTDILPEVRAAASINGWAAFGASSMLNGRSLGMPVVLLSCRPYDKLPAMSAFRKLFAPLARRLSCGLGLG